MNEAQSDVKSFDFYGTNVAVFSRDFTPVRQTLTSFQYFESNSLLDVTIKIFIENTEHKPASLFPIFIFRQAKSYGLSKRTVIYPENQSVIIQKKQKVTEVFIYGKNPIFLNELLFLTINSLVGWQKESEGWVRLHAMSFLEKNGAITLLGDSGTGKSTTAVKHIRKGNRIFSDEITLISPKGIVHTWPIPIQLSQKSVEELQVDPDSLSPFQKRLYATKYQMNLVEKNLAAPAPLALVRTPHTLTGALLRITLGTGLPQILEFQLRLDNLPSIAKVLSRRFYFATKLVLSKRLITSVQHED